jgi:hypothetical protein
MTNRATTTGKMVTSKVREERHARRGTGGNNRYSYHPDVTYEYVVDGKTYTGTRATEFSMGGTNFRGPTETFIKKYPKGAEVAVYYDPANPADSVLEKGGGSILQSQMKMAAVAAVAAVIIAAIYLVVVYMR